MPVPRGYTLASPACQFPSSLHYLKQNIQGLIILVIRVRAKAHVLTIFFHSEREKRYPDLSPVQENCPICYSFHNVQSLNYQCCFLCAVQWQERYSAMLVHAHKIVLCPCLCRLKLGTHYSINNNTIIYKLSGKFTTGRLWARQDKNFVEINWKTFMQKFDCLPLSSEENFTSGLNLKMIEA